LPIFKDIFYNNIIELFINNNRIINKFDILIEKSDLIKTNIDINYYNEIKIIENYIKKYYIYIFNITYNTIFDKEKLKLYIIACILKILIYNKNIDHTLCLYLNNIKKLIFLYNIL
jgi:hypothetical protein